MNNVDFLAVFWIIYGFAGLFGYTFVVPEKFKNKPWTKQYIKEDRSVYIFLGIVTLLCDFYFFRCAEDITKAVIIYLLLCSPALIYSFIIDRKYKNILKRENTDKQ